MKNLFRMDNPVMQALEVAADLMALNLLTLVCSLAIFTIGPAVTALHVCVIRLVRAEDGNLLRDYFTAFRSNFKKGCLLGLLLLGAAGLLWLDYRAALVYAPPLRYGIAALALLLLALAQYAFALLARYENTLPHTLKNAAALAVGYFPRTAGMLGFLLAFWLLAARFYAIGVPLLFLFGLSLPGYVDALLLQPVFQKLEGE